LASFFGGGTKRRANTTHPRLSSSSSSKRPRKIDGSHFGSCPICSASFPLHQLETHAATCTGESPKSVAAKVQPRTDESLSAVVHRIQHVSEPIPGLFLYENFITEQEERMILQELDGTALDHQHAFLPWKPANFNGTHLGKRWGVHCNLRDRRVSAPEHPLPHFVTELILPKLKHCKPMVDSVPNEANAIDYRRMTGHHLVAHVDDRKLSREPIANLSLVGSCYMTYRNVAPNRNAAVKEMRVLLKPRCLQILTGKARYDFSHAIDHRDLLSDRRISVTLRESPLSRTSLPPQRQDLRERMVGSLQRLPSLVNTLTPTSEPIPGLFLFDDFITEQEEALILQALDRSTDQLWKTERHSGTHREKRYGVEHDLWSKTLRPPKHPLPNFILEILGPKMKRISAMAGCIPNDINSIDYKRREGHSLKAHVDDRKKHKEPIANLSIAGDCFMTYSSVGSNTSSAVQEKRVLLKRRCLQVLTGRARYNFSHGIKNEDLLSVRRVSVTMRETL